MKRIFFIVLTVEVLIKGEVLGTRCGRTRSSQVRPIPIQESLVCHRYYEAPLATITTSNYHNPIRDEKRCFFRIKAPPGRRIKVTFNQFNLPRDDTTGTCLSYIEVTNVFRRRHKDIKPAPQLCGSSLPPAIHSIGNILQVKFFSQGLAAGQGFSLTYSTEEKGICGGNLLLPSGSISTPMFTRMRDSYVDCKWSVFGDRLDNITVVFKLHVLDVPGLRAKYCSQGGMYVKPGRGSGSKFYREFEIYCGNYTSPVIFTSPFPSTNILLSGFLDKPFRGIHGTYYVNNCGGIINAPSDVNITSPGYPNGYPPNTDCHWIIQADYGELITLTTVDLHLENDCEGDYVSISSAYDFHMLGKFCGDHRPYPVTSRHHVLSVKFHSDESGTAPGFWMTTSKIQR
ncbi:dorsal-ventral patterning tolloid-like protein 1, partial [Stegodyphus dumicola]|uniref:dorsal-ventral patterning tolloid-like protein 1 n=1 Tax=Stegodyphus dumicola TaxID=202533 RepID=UPI0015AC2DBE